MVNKDRQELRAAVSFGHGKVNIVPYLWRLKGE